MLKARRIILFVTFLLIVGYGLAVFFKDRKDYEMEKKAYDLLVLKDGTLADKLKLPKQHSEYWSLIGSAVLGLLPWLFATCFAGSKTPRIQMRKWPHIILLIVSLVYVAFSTFGFYLYFQDANKVLVTGLGVTDKGEATTILDANKDLLTGVWNDFQKTIYIIFAAVIGSIAIVAIFSIVQLVLIKKQRNSGDVAYSQEVQNFSLQ